MNLQLLSAVVNDRQSFAELTGDKEEVVGSLAKETLEQSNGILFETHLHLERGHEFGSFISIDQNP